MIQDIKQKKDYIIAATTAVLAIFYIYPIHGEEIFRISFGVVSMSVSTLVFPDSHAIKIGGLSGAMVVIFRTGLDMFMGTAFMPSLREHMPTFAFYLCFGALLQLLQKMNVTNPAYGLPWVFVAEMLSNFVESTIRGNFSFLVFQTIVISAALRTVITAAFVYMAQFQRLSIQHKEERKQFEQLNGLVSEIYAEMFYLKKSSQEIETVMNKSYQLYQNMDSDSKDRAMALEIAREVHEIRKDYQRVLSGLDGVFETYSLQDAHPLVWIFSLIEGNLRHVMEKKCSKTKVEFQCNGNCSIVPVYQIFVILNNLIANALDACEGSSWIQVGAEIQHDMVLELTVADGGGGIEEDVVPYIFSPGFTTKFDEVTGKASTGIGLSHVKNLVEELMGEITVTNGEQGAIFTIHLPMAGLTEKGKESYGKEHSNH